MRNFSLKQYLIYSTFFLLFTFAIFAAGKVKKEETIKAKSLTRLNSEDKDQLIDFFRLKKMFGSRVWPGLSETDIPLIQYNDQYEFLVIYPDPPEPWTIVEGDLFLNRPYYRRKAGEPRAFAVAVGDLWAGSLNILSHMNQKMNEQLRKKIPAEKLTQSMIKMFEITPAQHITFLIHETFHAFQATRFPSRFAKAIEVYGSEKNYPYNDFIFKEAWNKEGSLLAAALREKDETERRVFIQEFQEIRTKRRSGASLSPELVAFERELEWLEGLAKYVEMEFAELCYSTLEKAESKPYQIARNRSRSDFFVRIKKLGDLHGDLRFYLSGAIQAKILDKISPGWKKKIMNKENTSLEELLR